MFIVGLIIVSPVISVLMLQLHPVQEYLKNEAARYISAKTGMELSIGRVIVVLPNYFRIEEVKIVDHHKMLMLMSDRLSVHFTSFDPADQVIKLDRIFLKKAYLHQKVHKDEHEDNLSIFISRLAAPEQPEEEEERKAAIIRCSRLVLSDGIYKSDFNRKKSTAQGVDFYHLSVTGLYADFSNISFKGDMFSMKINNIILEEKSGLKISRLTALADISPSSVRLRALNLITDRSAIALDLSFHYKSFEDFNDFESRVFLKSKIGVTSLSTYDLGFFVPEFYHTNNKINLKGDVQGFVKNFRTWNFQFSVGSSSFDGDVAMHGLPDIENTKFTMNIRHLITDPIDIERFQINDNGFLSGLPVPDIISSLGAVSVNGTFDGTYRDFYTNASFSGGFGFISADMRMTHFGDNYSVAGELGVQQVDAGRILNYKDIGILNMDATLNGGGNSKSWEFEIAGRVHSLIFRDYNYRNVDIKGNVLDKMFTGMVEIEDENIALDFHGVLDFNGTMPVYNFDADIKNANLANLGFVPDTVRGLLSSRFSIDMQGDNPDNLAGHMNVSYAEFRTQAKNYLLNNFSISAFSTPENMRKSIAIRSDYLDGDIHGNFSFAEIDNSIIDFLAYYAPEFSGVVKTDIAGDNTPGKNDLHFNFTFRNTGDLTELFSGNRIETRKFTLEGSFRSAEPYLRLDGAAASVEIDGKILHDVKMNLQTQPEGLVVTTTGKKLRITDTLSFYAVNVGGVLSDDVFSGTVAWNFIDQADTPDAIIKSRIVLKDFPNTTIFFDDGRVMVKDTLWSISKGSAVVWRDNELEVKNLVFSSHGQSITVDGRAGKGSENAIVASFRKIDLSWIDFMTVQYDVNLDGIVDGDVTVRNLWENPRILADISIADFVYNNDPIGSVKIISLWDDQVKGMKINADFVYHGNIGSKKTAEIMGYLYPLASEKNNFDLIADLDNFRINFLSTLLSDISSDIRGFATGRLYLKGPFNIPELTGKLKVNARSVFVDYLNTRYSFADSVTLTRDAIIFNQVNLSDNNRLNTREPYSASINGSVMHKGFRDFSLNLNIKAENFTFLNTNGQQDPAYFGRALATGNVLITGPVEDILVTVQARTERNTILEIPLISSSKVTRSSFISFKNPNLEGDEFEVAPAALTPRQSNLRLDFNLQVTPDASVRLVFDPLIGDVIEGSGSGNILMNIGSNGEFDLRGHYTISKGDYIFNLENLISKKFSVKNGGTIRWTGDPYDAIMDIEAVYPTKASLAPLNPEDSAKTTQNVECIIHMTDRLFNPQIDFRIDLPDMSSFENERYQALIKPNLNYHFLSLLAINRFVNTQSQQFVESGSSANIAGANTSEMLANQLSVWISNISDEFDVDFAYHPRSGLSTEQVEAIIRTQVLNERLTLESKVGIGGRSYAGENQRTSNMVGDIIAEYRIDREGRFRIKAFNRYNEHNTLYEGAPYTQGVGVFYRREFNSFGDLLKRRSRDQE